MQKWPVQETGDLNRFFGNPDANSDGMADRKWETDNLLRVAPPYPMFLAWNMKPLTRITIHKKCAESLVRALTAIGAAYTPEERSKFQLDRFGGGYNFRMIRGGVRLSTHAYGAAIDLAPELNPLGRPVGFTPLMMPEKVVKIFEAEGAIWGGKWKRPDGQHFQFVRLL